MAKRRRDTIYGIGCITIKETYPARGTKYLYAEWSVGGRRFSKSCGNAADPESRRRAMEALRRAALARVEALQSEIGRLRAALGPDAG
jgi:hypothetical protein